MCAVSMVTDYYREVRWPVPLYPQEPFDFTKITITHEQWEEYQELKRRAEKYDQDTNQPDCVKPEVQEWEDTIVRVLKQQGILREYTHEGEANGNT